MISYLKGHGVQKTEIQLSHKKKKYIYIYTKKTIIPQIMLMWAPNLPDDLYFSA